jgi:hypothetical protein
MFDLMLSTLETDLRAGIAIGTSITGLATNAQTLKARSLRWPRGTMHFKSNSLTKGRQPVRSRGAAHEGAWWRISAQRGSRWWIEEL